MTIVAETAELPPRHGKLAAMALGALGVVYGDIGTSPLYTFKTAIEWAGNEASPRAALGMLSLIVWTLIITTSIKYVAIAAVPIVFWWQGMKGQTRILPVDTTMIAPTLANIVGVKPPADLDGTCFDLGFPGAPKCLR
jgi:hypothetical protein